MVTYPLFTVLDGFTQKSGKAEKIRGSHLQDRPRQDGHGHGGRPLLRPALHPEQGRGSSGKLHVIRNFGEAVKQVGGEILFEKDDNAFYRLRRMTRKYG